MGEFLLLGFIFCGLWTVLSCCMLYLLKNPIVIDVNWVISVSGISLIYYLFAENYNLTSTLYFVIILCWSARLGILVIQRLASGMIDPRYTDLVKSWGKKRDLYSHLLLAAEMMCTLILTVPFLYTVLYIPAISVYKIIFLALLLLCIIFEGIADCQLKKFKNENKTNKQVCNLGLWKYSRHPNYFFQWLFWLCGSLLVITEPFGYLTLVSPILMFVILYFFTGIPMAEKQSIKSKGSFYIDYQRSTSKFFPWFPNY